MKKKILSKIFKIISEEFTGTSRLLLVLIYDEITNNNHCDLRVFSNPAGLLWFSLIGPKMLMIIKNDSQK